jgi:hypothetical protein
VCVCVCECVYVCVCMCVCVPDRNAATVLRSTKCILQLCSLSVPGFGDRLERWLPAEDTDSSLQGGLAGILFGEHECNMNSSLIEWLSITIGADWFVVKYQNWFRLICGWVSELVPLICGWVSELVPTDLWLSIRIGADWFVVEYQTWCRFICGWVSELVPIDFEYHNWCRLLQGAQVPALCVTDNLLIQEWPRKGRL